MYCAATASSWIAIELFVYAHKPVSVQLHEPISTACGVLLVST